MDDTADGSEFAWAELKCRRRAAEKVARSYGGDVARVCDVCRQVRGGCGGDAWVKLASASYVDIYDGGIYPRVKLANL